MRFPTAKESSVCFEHHKCIDGALVAKGRSIGLEAFPSANTLSARNISGKRRIDLQNGSTGWFAINFSSFSLLPQARTSRVTQADGSSRFRRDSRRTKGEKKREKGRAAVSEGQAKKGSAGERRRREKER